MSLKALISFILLLFNFSISICLFSFIISPKGVILLILLNDKSNFFILGKNPFFKGLKSFILLLFNFNISNFWKFDFIFANSSIFDILLFPKSITSKFLKLILLNNSKSKLLTFFPFKLIFISLPVNLIWNLAFIIDKIFFSKFSNLLINPLLSIVIGS